MTVRVVPVPVLDSGYDLVPTVRLLFDPGQDELVAAGHGVTVPAGWKRPE